MRWSSLSYLSVISFAGLAFASTATPKSHLEPNTSALRSHAGRVLFWVESIKIGAAASASDPATPSAEPIAHTTPHGHTLLVPRHCFAGRASFDVVIHFHGLAPVLARASSQASLDAAVLVINEGIGTAGYAQRYHFKQSLPWLLEHAEAELLKQCPEGPDRTGRVALSAWSAGYAALQSMLSWPGSAERVDAVMLADALHAPYDIEGDVSELRLAPFVRFARAAVGGDKLFGFTHSAIRTPGYASTTESAEYLLEQLPFEAEAPTLREPWPEMHESSRFAAGSASITGYDGRTARSHAQHQWAIGRTLWRKLAQRWRHAPSG